VENIIFGKGDGGINIVLRSKYRLLQAEVENLGVGTWTRLS
jgi:hypothetical protein